MPLTSTASTSGFLSRNVSDRYPTPDGFYIVWKIPLLSTGTHNIFGFWLSQGQILSLLPIIQQQVRWASFSFLTGTAGGLFLKLQWYGTPSVQMCWLFFQKHTSSHKGNMTWLEVLAVPLQCSAQYQSWKWIYCTVQKHSSGQCHCTKA